MNTNPNPNTRREILKQGSLLALLVGCGMLTTQQALAADAPGFDAKTLEDALKALGGKQIGRAHV